MAWLDKELPVPLHQPMFLLKRLRIAGGEPTGIQIAHIPQALVPGLVAANLENASRYQVIPARFELRPAKARETYFDVPADPASAALLGLTPAPPTAHPKPFAKGPHIEGRRGMRHVLAVDLGGTKTAIALVDDAGSISEKWRAPAASSFEGSIEQIATCRAKFGAETIVAAGVIVPGIYEPATGNAWAPNLWGPEFQPLRQTLEQRLAMPFAIGSDRTGSVMAEQWIGAARGLRHVVFVAIGTGIGVGIVSDGRPMEGAHGIAGAAGWMVFGNPWKPEYAACGGWETEAAGPALARRAGMESALAVVAAARAGDARALEAVDYVAGSLALGIAGLISVLDPEMVVLGGGLMQAGDLMLEPIRSRALRWTQPIAARLVRVEKTALGEDAGLLGAARLAWLLAEA